MTKKTSLSNDIKSQIESNIELSKKILNEFLSIICDLGKIIASVVKAENKILICGNGGSAADAQHIAAEFINRFCMERRPLPAIALTTDTSVITSIGNDYDFKYIFSKQVSALGRKGDILLGISTSGNSQNIIEAVNAAKKKGIYTIAFTGQSGGKLQKIVDVCIKMPASETARVQEGHILISHLLCDIVEKELFGK